MWLKVFGIFAIVGFLGVSTVSQDLHPFHHLLRSDSEDSVSLYKVNLTTKSGIVKSGFENIVQISMEMIVQQYKNNTIFVRAIVENESRWKVKSFDVKENLVENDHQNKSFQFLLTKERNLIPQKDEEDLNARKALAGVLSIDWEALKKNEASNFLNSQDTIYGTCRVKYSVNRGENLSVELNFDPSECHNFQWWTLTDNDNVEKIDGLQISNSRKFDFIQDNNGKNFLKKLTAKQHVFFTPGKAGEVEHFLHTFYDIQLVEDEIDILVEKPSKDMFNFNDVHKLQIVPDDSGLLIFKDFRELTSFSDRSDSRNMSEITKLFFMLVTYKGGARKIFIRTDGMSDKMLTRDIASIVDYMKLFTEEELFTIYNATTDTTIIRNYNGEGLKFFLELLPLVGTSSATILTAKLIMDPEVEINREKMLSKLAGSITQASRESIKILKNLTMMENAPLEAFLAYSIAVSAMSKKTSNCYKGCYFLQNENEERLDEGFQYLLQRLNASVNYREQVVLVQAIGNLCYYKTFEALKSFKSSNKDLLIHIMYALGKSQMDSANYVEYFTNLIKQDLPTEARSVAVRLLLEHKYWDLNFEALTKRIYAEKDHELYNMFISSAEIFVEHLNVEQNANRMLRRLEPDARSRRFFFRAKKDQLGHLALSGHIIFDNTTKGFKQLRVDIVKYTYFEYVELYSFFLRVSDVAPISQLNNIGEDFFKQKNFTYEISLTKGSRTIFSTVAEYDFESLKKIVVSLLQNHFDEKEISKNFSINDVFSLINVDCFFPTDSGIYARAYHQTPFALDFMLKADKRVEDEKDIFGLILRANASLQNIQGLEILQPSLMFLQGSRQIINFQFTEQVALDGYHDQSKGFKNFLISKNKTFDPLFGLHYKKDTEVYLNFLKNTDELPLVVGEDRPDKEYRKTELTMQTFMDKLQQLFQQSLDELERINRFGYLNVTEEEVNPDKISLAKGDWSDLGLEYSIEMADCKAFFYSCNIPQSLPELFYMKPFSKILVRSPGNFLASLIDYSPRSFLLPSIYGVTWRALVSSSRVFDTDKISMSINKGLVTSEVIDSHDNKRVKYMLNVLNNKEDNELQIAKITPGAPSKALCLKWIFYDEMKKEIQIFYGEYEERKKDEEHIKGYEKNEEYEEYGENDEYEVYEYQNDEEYKENIKCPQNQVEIKIQLSFDFNLEQRELRKKDSVIHPMCRPASEIFPSEEARINYGCIKTTTMYRDIAAGLQYKNIPPAIADFFRSLGFWLFSNSNSFHKSAKGAKSSEALDIAIYRPMHSDEDFEMTLSTSEDTFAVKGSSKWLLMGNSAFKGFREVFQYFFIHPICRIYPEDLPKNSTNEWTLLGRISDNDDNIEIFGQIFEQDQLSLYVKFKERGIKYFPSIDKIGNYRVSVTDTDTISVFDKKSLSRAIIKETILIYGSYMWDNFNCVIGYNGRSIFIRGSFADLNKEVCFKN